MIQKIEKKEIISWHINKMLECASISAKWFKETNDQDFMDKTQWFINQTNELKKELTKI